MQHLGWPVAPGWLEGPLAPVQEVEAAVPETIVAECQAKVHNKPKQKMAAKLLRIKAPVKDPVQLLKTPSCL